MLCRMAPADALTSAGAFVFMPWLVRKRGKMFAQGFCVEAVIADNCGRGCRNGCLRGLLSCGGNGMRIFNMI